MAIFTNNYSYKLLILKTFYITEHCTAHYNYIVMHYYIIFKRDA